MIVFQLVLLSGCGLADRYLRSLVGEKSDDLPVFMDDFSDHDNGWLLTTTDKGVANYDGDSFRILINETNADYWSTPGLNLADTSTDVDTVRVTGPENNLFGLVCRWKDQDNFYGFEVSSDGYYGIVRVKDGQRKIISSDEMQTTDLIQKDGHTNHLRADCIGKTLTLYLNWTKLAEVDDDTFSQGDVGLIASTLDQSGTDIRFDNFIVRSSQK
jgi:hypothetical protein